MEHIHFLIIVIQSTAIGAQPWITVPVYDHSPDNIAAYA
jgi:hypothetical protein